MKKINHLYYIIFTLLFFLPIENLFAGGDFLELQKHVLCPFAKKATVWENKTGWDSSKSLENNIDEFIELELKPFVSAIKEMKRQNCSPIDGIVLEAPGAQYGKDLSHFAEFFRQVMLRINPESIKQLQNIEPDEAGIYWDNGWQFSYAGERLFTITMAPFYLQNNSRYNYGSKNVFIFFQPEYSFKYKLDNNKEKRDTQKLSVRKRFAKNHQTYDACKIMSSSSVRKTHEAPRYLKPIHQDSQEIVKWWLKNDKVNFNREIDQFRLFSTSSACAIQ